MIIEKGNKVHIIYRALFENSTRRHFLGEVIAADGATCCLEGFAFVYGSKSTMFVNKPEKRVTVADLGDSGYIVNIVDSGVKIDSVSYKYTIDAGLVATDNKSFTLNISEFGAKS
jgi:hypothetical protein